MKNGFWILPAALVAAFIFIATGCADKQSSTSVNQNLSATLK